MADEMMQEIVNLCLEVNKKAGGVYEAMAALSVSSEMQDFWRDLSEDEKRRITQWGKLGEMAERGALDNIFDTPNETREELALILGKVEQMNRDAASGLEPVQAFLLAYRLEFYLLHPAFATLAQFMQNVYDDSGEEDIEISYERHINRLNDALVEYEAYSPELDLLGKTMARLWQEVRKLASLSRVDSLTGTLNHRGVLQTVLPLSYLAQRKKFNVGILLVDIDNFRKLNEEHGYDAGDEALQLVAKVIKRRVRTSDIYGRYATDTFLVYLSSVDPDSVEKIGEDIRAIVAEESKENVPVTVSVGGATDQLHDNVAGDLYKLIQMAEERLVLAKDAGRDKVFTG